MRSFPLILVTCCALPASPVRAAPTPACGDANADLGVDVSDAVYLLAWLFLGGPAPACADLRCADPNGDGSVNIGDPSYLLNWLFLGGPRPGCEPGACATECPRVEGFVNTGLSALCLCEYSHEPTGMAFVLLPQGNFVMGSPDDECGRCDPPCDEGPLHEVTIRSFLLGKYEVTQAEWRTVAATDSLSRLDPVPSHFSGDDLPVEQVTWNDLQVFQEVSDLTLPTEAQWEYAARAGSAKPFPTGDTVTTDEANFNGQFPYCNEHDSQGLLRSRTLPVGSFEPNAFGLFDMAGNVHEWCRDAYDAEFYSKSEARGVDPVSSAGSPLRVLRGGAWLSIAQHLRCAFRGKSEPTTRFNLIGFRAAMPLEPAAE